MSDTTVFVPITKSIENIDGSRTVFGVMSDETLDLDQQIIDYGWLKSAAPDWFGKWANIREQHAPIAIGKGQTLDLNDQDHAAILASKIVDEQAVRKVDEGILSGYSVGIKDARVVHDTAAPNGRIVGGKLVEVSLVDHPANESCKVSVVKAAKSGELEVANGIAKVAQGDVDKLADPDSRKAPLSTSAQNDLPDSDFAYIEPGGKVVDGKTEPRSKRHFPVNDAAHVRNALARLSQSPFGSKAKAKVMAAAKKFGIDASDGDGKAATPDVTKDMQIPTLTGEEEQHNGPLAAALDAIKTLITQEMGEDDGEFDCVQFLGSIGKALICWANTEEQDTLAPMPFSVYCEVLPDLVKARAVDREVVREAVRKMGAELTAEPPTPAPDPNIEKAAALERVRKFNTDAAKAAQAITPDILKSFRMELVEDLAAKFATADKLDSVVKTVAEMGKRAAPGGPYTGQARTSEKSFPVNSTLDPGELPAEVASDLAKFATLAAGDDAALAASARRSIAKIKARFGLAE